jgi:hypothetical protein
MNDIDNDIDDPPEAIDLRRERRVIGLICTMAGALIGALLMMIWVELDKMAAADIQAQHFAEAHFMCMVRHDDDQIETVTLPPWDAHAPLIARMMAEHRMKGGEQERRAMERLQAKERGERP